MNISIKNISQIRSEVEMPAPEIFMLPEKILQFGTGVLLRALPDYFVDRANRQGIFNGRILIVKSTDTGGIDSFLKQDCLYTISVRGMEFGKQIDEAHVCSSVSRVLSAVSQWSDVMAAASNPAMQIVISNTTEVGIQHVQESIFQNPPVSFPGKLLAFLFERFRVFRGVPTAGMIIIPTELLTDNGTKLKSVLLELAAYNQLDAAFSEWLKNCNRFCSSLVDRIVPGKPDPATQLTLEQQWGYQDELMTICEPYRLWAIEGDEAVKKILSFCMADHGVVIKTDITQYRELKLRMLNATHSLSCGLAFLSGFTTVKEAMEDRLFREYVRRLMMEEIGPFIPFAIDEKEIEDFGNAVLDRFRNPHLKHQWLSITMQYSSKLVMRVLPVLKKYYITNRRAPLLISIGFAAYVLFSRPVRNTGGKYEGMLNHHYYPIQDDCAAEFYGLWEERTIHQVVVRILSNEHIWGGDLTQLEGFADSVAGHLKGFISRGILPEIAGYLKTEI